ncbi:hypothetical protein SLS58_006274 [Diplodia intermedia]|uniref:RanBP2-type domain-containing protein n=1 Tax=Diplodia intermedia TaxID=856260 RepID=A0ABR3TNI3_9PEZI
MSNSKSATKDDIDEKDERPMTWTCCQCGKTNSGDYEECPTAKCGHCPGMEGCCEWDFHPIITWVCCQCGKANSADVEECPIAGCAHHPSSEMS